MYRSVLFLALFFACSVIQTLAQWRNIGPRGVVSLGLGQMETDLHDPAIAYINTGSGFYRTTDMGQSWKRIDQPYIYLAYSVFLKSDPSATDTLYLGLAESMLQGALYRTTDGGTTWQTLFNHRIDDLEIHPVSKVLYASWATDFSITGGGDREWAVFKSTDGGATWEELFRSRSLGLSRLILAPQDPLLLYGVNQRWNAENPRLYRSTDGGRSWQAISSTPSRTIVPDPVSSGVFYAASQDGLFRSLDAGTSWEDVSPLGSSGQVESLLVHPASRDVYIWRAGLFRSSDRGSTWTALPVSRELTGIKLLAGTRSDPSIVYAGNTVAGLVRSTDRGETWTVLKLDEAPYRPMSTLALTPQGLYAVQEDAGLFRSSDDGQSWSFLSPNAPLDLEPDPWNPQTLYGSLHTTNSNGSNGGSRLIRSTDGGLSWLSLGFDSEDYLADITVDPTVPGILYVLAWGKLYRGSTQGGPWVVLTEPAVSFAADPNRPGVLYASNHDAFLKSTDRGLTWTGHPWDLSLGYADRIVPDPHDEATLYITVYGRIHKTTDGAKTWWALTTAHQLIIDPDRPNVLYAIGEYGVVRSLNGGISWTRFDDGLQVLGLDLLLDPDSSRLYLASDRGVFVREITGETNLFFPVFQQSDAFFTGYAIANSSGESTDVRFDAWSSAGGHLDVGTNPSSHTIGAGDQLALVGWELFGQEHPTPSSGWISASGTGEIGGFFLLVGPAQADGAIAATGRWNDISFSRILQGPKAFYGQPAVTTIFLANPTDGEMSVSLALHKFDQSPVTVWRTIAGHGMLRETLADLFGADIEVNEGRVLVTSSGLVGFETIDLGEGKSLVSLNGHTSGALGSAYSAQLANTPGARTNVKLINGFGDYAVTAILRAVGEDGKDLAPPVTLWLPGGAEKQADVAELFGFGNTPVVGSLVITTDRSGLIGDVLFGDFDTMKRAAALPLEIQPARTAVFSQVANGMGYYTGLALFNPNSEDATVDIEVFAADGQKTGQTQLMLAAGHRISKLLPELIASTAGQIRGHVQINSSQPLVMQQLFGTDELLAAVPPSLAK